MATEIPSSSPESLFDQIHQKLESQPNLFVAGYTRKAVDPETEVTQIFCSPKYGFYDAQRLNMLLLDISAIVGSEELTERDMVTFNRISRNNKPGLNFGWLSYSEKEGSLSKFTLIRMYPDPQIAKKVLDFEEAYNNHKLTRGELEKARQSGLFNLKSWIAEDELISSREQSRTNRSR